MIHHLDSLLRTLLLTNIDQLTDEGQVGFRPPDDGWRTHVSTLNTMALNVYLADVRENRKLRSNAQHRVLEGDGYIDTPAPVRIDCHYLITAWSPTTPSPQVEPTLDEHALYYEVIALLMEKGDLVPADTLETVPAGWEDISLPLQVLPVEGFGKLPEFWGTVAWRWKPMIYTIVTLPVIRPARQVGGEVTEHEVNMFTSVESKGD